MHIKSVAAKNFKRFTDLTISDLPPTARLVVLAGPNGYGKSSLFDLFLKSLDQTSGHAGYEHRYHLKVQDDQNVHVAVKFHEGDVRQGTRKWFYFRSAYRNDPEFNVTNIERVPPVLEERRFGRFIDNDAAVRVNYQRMYAQGMEDVYENEPGTMTLNEFRENFRRNPSATSEGDTGVKDRKPGKSLQSANVPVQQRNCAEVQLHESFWWRKGCIRLAARLRN